ncbi:MAG TPA: hypothetical protein VF038_12780 [Usitatibacter sp.]
MAYVRERDRWRPAPLGFECPYVESEPNPDRVHREGPTPGGCAPVDPRVRPLRARRPSRRAPPR